MSVKRYVVGMDFQGGSPIVEADDHSEEHYPHDSEFPYRRWKFVREEDYDAAQARIRELEDELEKSVNNARANWIDAEQQAQRVRELEAALTNSIERHRVNADWKAKHHELEAERDALVGALDYELAYNNAKARIRELEAAMREISEYTQLLSDSTALVTGRIATSALASHSDREAMSMADRFHGTLSAETEAKRMPPREFDIESHQGLYAEPKEKS